MDLNNLTPEEQQQLAGLMAKADGEAPVRARGVPPPTPADRGFGVAPPANPPTVTRVPDPTVWVDKQIRTLEAVGEENYRIGITQPKKDPIAAGIAAQAKYVAKMRDPEVLQRRVTSLQATSMEEWASMSERVGARRLVEGVVERKYKVERFVANYQPKLVAHLRTIDAMPAVTDADMEKRMIENRRGLKALKGQMK